MNSGLGQRAEGFSNTYGILSQELSALKTEIQGLKSPHAKREVLSPSKYEQPSTFNYKGFEELDDDAQIVESVEKENLPSEYLVSPSIGESVAESKGEDGLVGNLKAKEEEVNVLWNVIKELNKNKDDKMDMEKLSKLIQ